MKRRKAPTNVNNSFQKRKNDYLKSLDRISALPDSILCLIVSFLPTKDAVATSILSKRWKLVWTTVHNLDFCHELPWDEDGNIENMIFVQFVNRVLRHHAGFLNKFRLVWNKCILSHASSWIRTAIRKNVHELVLCVETLTGPRYESFQVFEMPICVFSCVSLQSLELNGGIDVSATIPVCLPRLESLKLVSVRFESGEAFENFMSGCPKLIYLQIHTPNRMLEDFGQDDDFTYIISSTSLRRLELCIEYEIPEAMYCYYRSLELEASSLEYLRIVGFIPDIILRKSLGSLIKADLKIDLHLYDFANADVCNSIVEAVRVFDCAKVVTLSADVMWALNCATNSLSTKFTKLVKLEAETYYCGCSSLRDFIQSSDNLEVLTIYQLQFPFLLAKAEHHDHSSWTTPLEVARCLSNGLKKVVLEGYHGGEDEREMIRYLLKNGSSLEAMQISCHKDKNGAKFDLVQEICQFPRQSPVCEVKFICWTSNSMA